MNCICKYNPVTDLNPVAEFGFVDLVECLSKGEVPASIGNTDELYNDIDDPSTIIGKPKDNFEAIRLMDHIKSSGVTATTETNE